MYKSISNAGLELEGGARCVSIKKYFQANLIKYMTESNYLFFYFKYNYKCLCNCINKVAEWRSG